MTPSDPNDPKPSGEPAGRKRPRRAMIDQLYESLQQEAPTLAKARSNSIGMKLVLLPEGSFLMGSSPKEKYHRLNEGPGHEVLLTQSFYIGIHPVTQEQYQRIMSSNPARFQRTHGGGPDHPVENVSWEDAVRFCQRLGDLPAERQEGLTYRLPTEAEWEYACRAGTTSAFSFGESLTSVQANCNGQYPCGETRKGPCLEKTSPVGSYPANNFGLFDMHGNVWEWCADWYSEFYYAESPPRDPTGPVSGELRVVRGGSWRNQAVICRSAYRNALLPYNHDPYTGFRVVAVASR